MLSLFSEISRVLASGGQLLMKESTPNSRRYATQIELAEGTANFGFFVTSALRRFGLEHVRAEPGKMWPGKDYLFDENRDFDRYPASISVGSAEFYARKQPQ